MMSSLYMGTAVRTRATEEMRLMERRMARLQEKVEELTRGKTDTEASPKEVNLKFTLSCTLS